LQSVGSYEAGITKLQILQYTIAFANLPTTQSGEEDDDQLPQPMYSIADAKQALHILIGFAESQESLSSDYLRTLERLESAVEGIQQASLVQGTLDNVFHIRVAHPNESPTKTPKSDYYYYYYTTTLHNDP
jgi:hypothetical protein